MEWKVEWNMDCLVGGHMRYDKDRGSKIYQANAPAGEAFSRCRQALIEGTCSSLVSFSINYEYPYYRS